MSIHANHSTNNELEPELVNDLRAAQLEAIQNDENLKRVNGRLTRLASMVEGVCNGDFNGFVVQGAKGLGKSHTVHQILDKYDPNLEGNEEMPENQRRSIKRFTGKITPLQLFLALQEYSGKKCILLFDDCDSAFNDISALNLLKAALDHKERRIVTWATTSRLVRNGEQQFEFKGSVILITNAGFKSEHYKAFLDRVHMYPVKMTPDERLSKIREIAFTDSRVDFMTAYDVVSHIENNLQLIGDRLSMRTYVKVLELVKLPDWKEFAVDTVFNNIESEG